MPLPLVIAIALSLLISSGTAIVACSSNAERIPTGKSARFGPQSTGAAENLEGSHAGAPPAGIPSVTSVSDRQAQPRPMGPSGIPSDAPERGGKLGSPPVNVVEACPEKKLEHWIRVEGDGQAQLFKAGAPVIPFKIRSCEPAQFFSFGGLVVGACAESAPYHHSCIWCSDKRGMYVAQDGTEWKLRVVNRNLSETADSVRGDIIAVGQSKASNKRLQLRIKVDVGRDVAATEAPDVYPRSSWSDDG